MSARSPGLCRDLLQKAALNTVLEKWDGTKKGQKGSRLFHIV